LAAAQHLAPYGDGHRSPIPRPPRTNPADIATKIDRHVPVAYSRFMGEDEMAAERQLAPYGDGLRSPYPSVLRPPTSATVTAHRRSGNYTHPPRGAGQRSPKGEGTAGLIGHHACGWIPRSPFPLPQNNNVYRWDDDGDAAAPCLRQRGLRR